MSVHAAKGSKALAAVRVGGPENPAPSRSTSDAPDDQRWKLGTGKRGVPVQGAPPVMRIEGRQASVGLDTTKLYEVGTKLPVLQGLSPALDQLQKTVNADFEQAPQRYVDRFLTMVATTGEPPVFTTDDAKGALLPEKWLGAQGLSPEVKEFRAGGANAAMHQAAHAVTQLAFIQELDKMNDKLPEGDPRRAVLVMNGGCGAGKGYALREGFEGDFKSRFGAIFDPAGEQSALDNQWIVKAAASRGIKVTLVHVKADPVAAFARAVTKRFDEEGRLVNTRSFAESYVDGAVSTRKLINNFGELPGEVELVVIDNSGGGTKPKSWVFSKDNIEEAVASLDTLVPKLKSIEELEWKLKAAIPADMPAHGKFGLGILDR